MKKTIRKYCLKYKPYKIGGFEAGIVKGSKHLNNNIYLLMYKTKEEAEILFDVTVDEAAAIASVLTKAIADWTLDKRHLLKP